MVQVRLLWEMVSYNIQSDGWQLGMVPVRANSVEDIVQNYTVNCAKNSLITSFSIVASCGNGSWGSGRMGSYR